MNIISRVKFNLTADRKGLVGEITVTRPDGTREFPELTASAITELLKVHKAGGGTVRGFRRTVALKNAEAATRLGKRVGDKVEIIDYSTDPMSFECDIGGGYADNVRNIRVLSTVADAAVLVADLGNVQVVDSKPRKAAAVSEDAEADVLS